MGDYRRGIDGLGLFGPGVRYLLQFLIFFQWLFAFSLNSFACSQKVTKFKIDKKLEQRYDYISYVLNDSRERFTPDEIVENAQAFLDNQEQFGTYNLAFHNCENFANKCLYKNPPKYSSETKKIGSASFSILLTMMMMAHRCLNSPCVTCF